MKIRCGLYQRSISNCFGLFIEFLKNHLKPADVFVYFADKKFTDQRSRKIDPDQRSCGSRVHTFMDQRSRGSNISRSKVQHKFGFNLQETGAALEKLESSENIGFQAKNNLFQG